MTQSPWFAAIKPEVRATVRAKYLGHLQSLKEWGIIGRVESEPRFVNGYFCVDKDAKHSRAILNGKALSTMCPAAPPVNLPTIHAVLREIRQAHQGRRKLFFMCGDLRHWFHQMRTPAELNTLFGLRSCEGEGRYTMYRWLTLPMGWSHSPAIAQAFCWCVLAWRPLEGKKALEEDAFKGNTLPTFARLVSGGGWATCYYDNFIVLSWKQEDVDAAQARLRLAVAETGVVVKPGSLHVGSTTEGMEYLGLIFKREVSGLTWRPRKLEGWQEEWLRPEPPWRSSPRQLARQIGRLVFVAMSSGQRLNRTEQGRATCKVAQTLGRAMHGRGEAAWDEVGFHEELLKEIDRLWSIAFDLLVNPYRAEGQETRPDWVLCSDASKKGFGWILLRRNGEEWEVQKEGKKLWTADERAETIFKLEMRAMLIGFRAARHEVTDKVYLFVDNAALAWCAETGICHSEDCEETWAEWSEIADHFDTILATSEDNPADCPSRDTREGLPRRLKAMEACIEAHEKGWRWSTGPRRSWREEPGVAPTTGRRHRAE